MMFFETILLFIALLVMTILWFLYKFFENARKIKARFANWPKLTTDHFPRNELMEDCKNGLIKIITNSGILLVYGGIGVGKTYTIAKTLQDCAENDHQMKNCRVIWLNALDCGKDLNLEHFEGFDKAIINATRHLHGKIKEKIPVGQLPVFFEANETRLIYVLDNVSNPELLKHMITSHQQQDTLELLRCVVITENPDFLEISKTLNINLIALQVSQLSQVESEEMLKFRLRKLGLVDDQITGLAKTCAGRPMIIDRVSSVAIDDPSCLERLVKEGVGKECLRDDLGNAKTVETVFTTSILNLPPAFRTGFYSLLLYDAMQLIPNEALLILWSNNDNKLTTFLKFGFLSVESDSGVYISNPLFEAAIRAAKEEYSVVEETNRTVLQQIRRMICQGTFSANREMIMFQAARHYSKALIQQILSVVDGDTLAELCTNCPSQNSHENGQLILRFLYDLQWPGDVKHSNGHYDEAWDQNTSYRLIEAILCKLKMSPTVDVERVVKAPDKNLTDSFWNTLLLDKDLYAQRADRLKLIRLLADLTGDYKADRLMLYLVKHDIEKFNCEFVGHRRFRFRQVIKEAASLGFISIVRCVCEKTVPYKIGSTCFDVGVQEALEAAAVNGKVKVVDYLVSKYPKTLSANARENRTKVFHAACQNGYTDMVRLLLTYDTRLCLEIDLLGNSGIALAARNGHRSVVQLVLVSGQKLLPNWLTCLGSNGLEDVWKNPKALSAEQMKLIMSPVVKFLNSSDVLTDDRRFFSLVSSLTILLEISSSTRKQTKDEKLLGPDAIQILASGLAMLSSKQPLEAGNSRICIVEDKILSLLFNVLSEETIHSHLETKLANLLASQIAKRLNNIPTFEIDTRPFKAGDILTKMVLNLPKNYNNLKAWIDGELKQIVDRWLKDPKPVKCTFYRKSENFVYIITQLLALNSEYRSGVARFLLFYVNLLLIYDVNDSTVEYHRWLFCQDKAVAFFANDLNFPHEKHDETAKGLRRQMLNLFFENTFDQHQKWYGCWIKR